MKNNFSAILILFAVVSMSWSNGSSADSNRYFITIDDFEGGRIEKDWYTVNDADVGRCINTVVPGNSSTSFSVKKNTNTLDSSSLYQAVWYSYIGNQMRKAYDHYTDSVVADGFIYSQTGIRMNFSGTEGITFQAYSEKQVRVSIILTTHYDEANRICEQFEYFITVGPEWKTYTISYGNFRGNSYWVPSDPNVIPEKILAVSFQIDAMYGSNDCDKHYSVLLDNIRAYSSKPIKRQAVIKSGKGGKIRITYTPETKPEELLIGDSTDISIRTNTDALIKLVPDSGYKVFDFILDNKHYGPIDSFLIKDISKEHSIEVSFVRDTLTIHTITTSTDGLGNIVPEGVVPVLEDSSKVFVINTSQTDNIKTYLKKLFVDTIPVKATNIYTFENVRNSHKFHAVFDTITWNLTLHYNFDSTTIDPITQVYTLPESTSYLIDFEKYQDYSIKDVIIDSVSVGPVSSYLFRHIIKDHFVDIKMIPSNRIIDDFEDGDLISRSGGVWVTGSDADEKEPNEPGNSTSSITIQECDRNPFDKKCLVWKYSMGDVQAKDSMGIGMGNWAYIYVDLALFSADGFKGIVFNAKATEQRNRINVEVTCGKTPYRANVLLSTEWERYYIPFTDFSVPSWYESEPDSFIPAAITNIGLIADYSSSDSGEIYLSDFQLYTDKEVVIVEGTKEGNGKIYPHGQTVCIKGSSQDFSFITDSNTTVSDVIVNNISAGSCEKYSYSADSSGKIQVLFNYNSGGQEITFNTLGPKTYGDSPFVLTATASSNLPLTYISSDTSVATVTDSTVAIHGAGHTIITAIQEGNDSIFPANPKEQVLVVNPKEISVTDLKVMDKVYDGNRNGLLSGNEKIEGVLNGDDVHLHGSVKFASKNVGDSIDIRTEELRLMGENRTNYKLLLPANLSASITPKPVKIGNIEIMDKTYDGTDKAKIRVGREPKVLEMVEGDSLVISGSATAQFEDKSAGNEKKVFVSGYKITGPDAGNYLLEQPIELTASIFPEELIITAKNATKIENSPDPVFTVLYWGFVDGEDSTIVKGLQIRRTEGEVPGFYDIIPFGAVAANYDITYENGKLTIDRPVSVQDIKPGESLNNKRYGISIANNPVNLSYQNARINICLPEACHLKISIYDGVGNLVYNKSLMSDKNGSTKTLLWDLRNTDGLKVSTGTYLIRLSGHGIRSSQQYHYKAKLGVKRR